MNLLAYIGLFALTVLYFQDFLSDYYRSEISWYVFIYKIFCKIILTIYLVGGGLKLLKTVNHFSVVKPTKLQLYVYLVIITSILAMLVAMIVTTVVIIQQSDSSDSNM